MRLLSIGVLFLLFVSCSKKDKKENSYPIQKVETAKVLKYTIPQFLEAIGHVKAFNSAEIRAQVEGRLIKNHYTQGSIASKDELLICHSCSAVCSSASASSRSCYLKPISA